MSYMNQRFVLLWLLIDLTYDEKTVLLNRLKKDKDSFNEFSQWVKKMINIREKKGGSFPEDFKELFI